MEKSIILFTFVDKNIVIININHLNFNNNVLIKELGDHRVPENWVQHPVINTEASSNPGAPLAWGSPENPDDVVAGYGYVGADTLLAFVYPVIAIAFLFADMFLTTFTTDCIIHVKKKKRILLMIIRDIAIILLCFWTLTYLENGFILVGGTLCYAFPKIIKIILCDIIDKQRYLDVYIDI